MDWIGKKANGLFLCLLILIWGAFHYRVIFEGNTFVFSDASSFFFPLWKWGGSVLRTGHLPLWNPQACFGTPYLADPQMAYWYPPVLVVYRFFTTVNAFNVLLLSHHLWAILGFWFFARGRRYSPAISFLGTLLFAFSFQAICLFWACTMLLAFSWIPWVFWSFEEMMKGKRVFFILFSFSAAMQLAAGYPVFFYLTFLILAVDWIGEQIGNGSGVDWRRILKGAMGYILALAIAFLYNMAWIIPFEEFLKLSNATKRLATVQSLDMRYLGTLLDPFLLGQPLYSHPQVPLSVSVCFMGLPVIAVILIMVVLGKARKVSFAVFLLTLILSVGHPFKVFDWFRSFVPGYVWVVRSGYIIPLVIFSGAWLFMESISVWMKEKNKRDKEYWCWFVISVLIFAFALHLGVPVVLRSFWLSLIFLLCVGLKTNYPAWLRWLFLIGSVVLSMGPVLWGINFTMDRSYYEKNPAVCQFLDSPGRVYFSLRYVMDHSIFSGNSVSDAYEHLNASLTPNRPLIWGEEETMMNNTFFLPSYLRWDFSAFEISKSFSKKVLDYLGVQYVFGKNSLLSLWPLGNPDWSLYKNPHPMGKWFSVVQALSASDWKSDFERESENGFDFANECFVGNGSNAGSYSRRVVKEIFRSPDQIDFFTQGNGKAFLASSETDYPGWQIKVGNYWRPVDDVNDGFRGFVLENQEKEVSMVYRPTSFRLGCFLSLLAVSFWVIFIYGIKKDLNVTS